MPVTNEHICDVKLYNRSKNTEDYRNLYSYYFAISREFLDILEKNNIKLGNSNMIQILVIELLILKI